MKITKDQFKGIVREVMIDESEYQTFFAKALEKTGKSIPDMSDEEKKAFFNKIDSAWDAKGEKNEELTGNQHKLDVDGDGEIEASDLAALRAGKTNEAKYPTSLYVNSIIYGQGFTGLKGIEGGKYYKVVEMDDTTATLAPSDQKGKITGSNKVRHKLSSLEGSIKTAKRGDENGIVIESVNEAMASGAWVGLEKTPKGPKLVKTFKSGNEAKAWVMKSPGGHSIMTKKDWDVSEGKSEVEDVNESSEPLKLKGIKINKKSPVTFVLEISFLIGNEVVISYLTTGTSQDAQKLKSKVEKAFSSGKIVSPSGIGYYAYNESVNEATEHFPSNLAKKIEVLIKKELGIKKLKVGHSPLGGRFIGEEKYYFILPHPMYGDSPLYSNLIEVRRGPGYVDGDKKIEGTYHVLVQRTQNDTLEEKRSIKSEAELLKVISMFAKKHKKLLTYNGMAETKSVNEAPKPTIKVVNKLKNEQGIQIVVVKTTKGETMYGGFVVRGKLQKVIPAGANNSKEDVQKRALQIWDEFGKQLGERINEDKIDWADFYKMAKDRSGHNPNFEKKYGKVLSRPHVADAVKTAKDFKSFMKFIQKFENI